MGLYPTLWLITSFTQVMSCLLAAQPPFAWGRRSRGRSKAGTPLATVSRSAFSCPRRWAGAKGEEFGSTKNSSRADPAAAASQAGHPGAGAALAGALPLLTRGQDKRRSAPRPRGGPCPAHIAFPRGGAQPYRVPCWSWRSPSCPPLQTGHFGGAWGGPAAAPTGSTRHFAARPSQYFILGATEQGQAPRGAGCIGFPPVSLPPSLRGPRGAEDGWPRTALPPRRAAPVVGSFAPPRRTRGVGVGSGFVAQVRGASAALRGSLPPPGGVGGRSRAGGEPGPTPRGRAAGLGAGRRRLCVFPG